MTGSSASTHLDVALRKGHATAVVTAHKSLREPGGTRRRHVCGAGTSLADATDVAPHELAQAAFADHVLAGSENHVGTRHAGRGADGVAHVTLTLCLEERLRLSDTPTAHAQQVCQQGNQGQHQWSN